ncbi:tyrosine-protein kinase RYK-like isoform X2 [Pomacea canaliculata]|uniref:tyrosine-protein kinase RYK-like isoform X2 n=1 Tax=Pomacea canaliculata TaxID=400727 RepID=UPI000D73A9C3|nr:tyrosine-protein kinase RYK-like isoform X2 [Pomacea canaliculata]
MLFSWLILRFLPFFGSICVTTSNLNLYMDAKETRRLLGLQAELYYVRDGIINSYALSFNLPVSANIDHICFTWQSLRENPQMFYSMNFSVSNPRAMRMPEPDISLSGIVPNELSEFKVTLPCSGLMSAEVDIRMQMNINIFSASNLTVLNFKRRKICLKDNSIWVKDPSGAIPVGARNSSQLYKDLGQTFSSSTSSDASTSGLTTSTHIFYIAVGCTCALILLTAMAVAVYYLNSQRSMDRYSRRINYYSSQALTAQSQTFLRPDTPNNASGTGLPNFRRGISPASELKPTDMKTVLKEIAIERKAITLGELLLEGTFGRIYHGTVLWEDEDKESKEQEVVVKTVTDQARPDQVSLFLTESMMLKGMAHVNIYTVLGACSDDAGAPPLVVYPHTKEGNMKKFLQKCRMSECGSRYTLNTQQLVYMAIQIIRGVQYLHRKKIIHKDIATRNCVVDQGMQVLVTDNSLARDLFPNDYNCLGDNENRPVKWMSVEALVNKCFSPASDVWAFGVTLWEMMTLGQQPYADIDPFEMAAYLQEGYRIAQPHNCPDELFAVMACCWAMSPDERPKFTQLLVCLQDFYTALGRFI